MIYEYCLVVGKVFPYGSSQFQSEHQESTPYQEPSMALLPVLARISLHF